MLGAVPPVLGSRAVRGLIGQIGGQARSKFSSFGALFTLELLDLVALALDRALLMLDLTLLLLRGDFLILQRIADHVAGARPERTADRRTCGRMSHRGADYCPGAGTEHATTQRPLFASRQWLSTASGQDKASGQEKSRAENQSRGHGHTTVRFA
jgi:hypothetical protein